MPRITTGQLALLASLTSMPAHALGQGSVAISLTHGMDSSVVEIGQVVTWTLTMEHFGFEDGALNGSIFAALIPSITDIGFASDFAYTPDFNGGTNGGIADGLGFELINFTNLTIGGFGNQPPLPDNPLIIGTFTTTVTDTGSGPLTYQLAQSPQVGQGFPVATVELNAFSNANFTLEQIEFTSDFIVIPSPAAALLLPGAWLIGIRRRRHA